MPFGSDPFRDLIRPKLIQQLKSFCHQCLSAVIPFGTPLVRRGVEPVECGSPMPFGSDPFRDK